MRETKPKTDQTGSEIKVLVPKTFDRYWVAQDTSVEGDGTCNEAQVRADDGAIAYLSYRHGFTTNSVSLTFDEFHTAFVAFVDSLANQGGSK